MNELITGQTASVQRTVTEEFTAAAVGSGSLPVFGTPCMIALMEAATCACVQAALEEDETTVGTRVEITHSRATVTGKAVTATAVLLEADGRRLLFQVRCEDPAGLVGEGRIERFVVRGGKFMEKAVRA